MELAHERALSMIPEVYFLDGENYGRDVIWRAHNKALTALCHHADPFKFLADAMDIASHTHRMRSQGGGTRAVHSKESLDSLRLATVLLDRDLRDFQAGVEEARSEWSKTLYACAPSS